MKFLIDWNLIIPDWGFKGRWMMENPFKEAPIQTHPKERVGFIDTKVKLAPWPGVEKRKKILYELGLVVYDFSKDQLYGVGNWVFSEGKADWLKKAHLKQVVELVQKRGITKFYGYNISADLTAMNESMKWFRGKVNADERRNYKIFWEELKKFEFYDLYEPFRLLQGGTKIEGLENWWDDYGTSLKKMSELERGSSKLYFTPTGKNRVNLENLVRFQIYKKNKKSAVQFKHVHSVTKDASYLIGVYRILYSNSSIGLAKKIRLD